MADVAFVSGADFRAFNMVRPGRGTLRGLLKMMDLLLKTGILRFFVGFAACKIFLPGGIISVVNFNVGRVDRENVVDTVIEKGAVVADEDEPAFAAKIACHRLASCKIEMVRWLVNERERGVV